MIHTDGKRTIANAPVRKRTASERIRQARELRERALDVEGIRNHPVFAELSETARDVIARNAPDA